jgi:hypothetical protein
MRKILLAASLAAMAPMFGCGTMEKTMAGWDEWRADRNEKAGNYGTADDYRRRADQRRADAERHRF